MIRGTRRTMAAVMAVAAAALAATACMEPTAVRAQGAPGGRRPTPQQMQQMRAMRTAFKERMFRMLNVTPAQRKKLNAIEARTNRQMEARIAPLRASKTRPAPQKLRQMNAQIRAIAQRGQTEMLAVLTPAQRAKLKQIMSGMRQRPR